MILHGYWRSGAAYRTRIALELKGLTYEQRGVDLRTGSQRSDAFVALNPQGMVPALEIDGAVLTQSPAILEWLERRVGAHGSGWCFGSAPTLADCYLIPQIYSARRFNVPLEAFPRLLAIDVSAQAHPAFVAAHPDNQPDAD